MANKEINKKLEKIATSARGVGIHNYVMLVKTGDQEATVKFENIKMGEALQLIIAGFHQAIAIDLDQHPEYDDEYRELLRNLSRDFTAIIANSNDNILKYKKKRSKGKK